MCVRVPCALVRLCPASGWRAAGKWGDYKCDVPHRTVLNLFEHLKATQDQFDWIYWTGDVTPHNIWNQTRTGTVTALSMLSRTEILLYFNT